MGQITFDLVGPFPCSKDGFKYVLTSICMASKFPDAVPLIDISAKTVADAIMGVWSRNGIPCEVLTDRGTQFTSRLFGDICDRLAFKHTRCSPYHPQSNGAFERLHETMVPMFKKTIEGKLLWPKQLKFVLFVLQAMPARETGFTLFKVVHGRNLHTPLELLYDSWLGGDNQSKSLLSWMEDFDKRVAIVHEPLREKLSALKDSQREENKL